MVVNVAMQASIHISSKINSAVTGGKYPAAVIFNAKTVRLCVVMHDRYDEHGYSLPILNYVAGKWRAGFARESRCKVS